MHVVWQYICAVLMQNANAQHSGVVIKFTWLGNVVEQIRRGCPAAVVLKPIALPQFRFTAKIRFFWHFKASGKHGLDVLIPDTPDHLGKGAQLYAQLLLPAVLPLGTLRV